MENLRKVESLPVKKVEMLKDALVLIKEFCAENNLDTDVFEVKSSTDRFIQVRNLTSEIMALITIAILQIGLLSYELYGFTSSRRFNFSIDVFYYSF